MKKALFVTYGGGHVNIVIPLVKEIKRRKCLDCTVIGLTTAVTKLENEGVEHKTLAHYIDCFKEKEKIIEIGEELAQKHHNYEDKKLKYKDSVIYYGLSMYDMICEHGEMEANNLFEENGRQVFLPLGTANRIIDIEKPDIVVTTCDRRMEKAFTLAANRRDIPTVMIHDLYVKREGLPYYKYHYVMNELAKKNLISSGVDSDNIYITGQPAFSDIFERKYNPNKILSDIGIIKNKPVVTWASAITEGFEMTFNEIINTFRDNDRYRLIIKLHPSQSENEFRDVLEKNKMQDVVLIKDYNIHDIIYISDVIITEYSTSGLEAILMNKPLITVNLTGAPYGLRYDDTGAAIGVYNKGGLCGVLEKALYDKETRERISYYAKQMKMPAGSPQIIVDRLANI